MVKQLHLLSIECVICSRSDTPNQPGAPVSPESHRVTTTCGQIKESPVGASLQHILLASETTPTFL